MRAIAGMARSYRGLRPAISAWLMLNIRCHGYASTQGPALSNPPSPYRP